MIRTLIADDEPLARQGLRLHLSAHADIEIVAECANGREALAALKAAPPDLALLDIEMPGLNGVAVAQQLSRLAHPPRVVFVTAFDRYAIEAFRAEAMDYLLKPLSAERVGDTLRRVRAALDQRRADSQRTQLLAVLRRLSGHTELTLDDALQGELEPDCLRFEDSGTLCRLPLSDIDYVEAAGDYMCIRARSRTYVVRITLSALDQRLRDTGFQRIHRATLVNLQRVRELAPNGHGDATVRLADGTELRCSRSYRKALREALAVTGPKSA